MGNHVEPFTVTNMIGLMFVCVGFLVYTGLGLANHFIVAQVYTVRSMYNNIHM
jgi:hypothetical protein